jgi:hypothetical protein
MTTLNFNRKEKLSRIEMMLVANLIDNVLSYETSVSSSLMNKLSGIYDGYLYSFSQELEVFENEVKVGNFENKVLAYRLAQDIKTLESELRNRLS